MRMLLLARVGRAVCDGVLPRRRRGAGQIRPDEVRIRRTQVGTRHPPARGPLDGKAVMDRYGPIGINPLPNHGLGQTKRIGKRRLRYTRAL